MTVDEFNLEYPGLPEHELKSADDSCPWNPECERGQAYIMGYLIRAWEHHQYKKLKD